jgi:ParB family transcriptional regulator, chromosome partitioning protein
MARTQPTVVLSRSQDIPFNKLVLSQANVRRIKTGLSIEELAEDIARRGLLQSLSVRPVRDAGGADTGVFEVPAGGRRFRALDLLVKQKRMAKTQPVPCVVREDGIAEEDSLAENVQRVALHPLDQFRAFQTLRDAGLSEEDIAARFFVGANVVKQRLKLVAVSPKLLDLYAADEMTLEQLMAFTVTDDQARQEQVWEGLASAYNKEPYYIRRQLTETAIRASDKRALRRRLGLRGRGRHRHARPVRAGQWRLAAGRGAARPPGDREAHLRGRGPANRGLEMDRGCGRVPLRPWRRVASPDRHCCRSQR